MKGNKIVSIIRLLLCPAGASRNTLKHKFRQFYHQANEHDGRPSGFVVFSVFEFRYPSCPATYVCSPFLFSAKSSQPVFLSDGLGFATNQPITQATRKQIEK